MLCLQLLLVTKWLLRSALTDNLANTIRKFVPSEKEISLTHAF